jgi:hypothetical protein
MKKLKIPKSLNKKSKKIGILIIIFTFILNFVSINNLFFDNNTDITNPNPKISGWLWATLDLTNPLEVNNSRFAHNELIIKLIKQINLELTLQLKLMMSLIWVIQM